MVQILTYMLTLPSNIFIFVFFFFVKRVAVVTRPHVAQKTFASVATAVAKLKVRNNIVSSLFRPITVIVIIIVYRTAKCKQRR